jgi:hypothetical protein
MEKLVIEEKVSYMPYKGCSPSEYQNGIVKSHPEHTTESVFVVYNCGGDWKNYKDYTAALTPISSLKKGWAEEVKCDHYFLPTGKWTPEGSMICQDCGEMR